MTTIKTIKENIKIGCHIQKTGTVFQSLQRLKAAPMTAYQIYISNARSYELPNMKDKDIEEALKVDPYLASINHSLVIHGSLLVNMCGATELEKDASYLKKMSNARNTMVAELDIGVLHNCGVIFHIGSCSDKKRGIDNIVDSIVFALTNTTHTTSYYARKMNITDEQYIKKRKIILENSAGEGNKLGSTLEEIAKILFDKNLDIYRKQITLCIDTAHIHGAGEYDLGNEEDIDKFFNKIDTLKLKDYVKVIHLNDSLEPLKSKKDKHETITFGYIWWNKEVILAKFLQKLIKNDYMIINEPPDPWIMSWLVLNEYCNDVIFE
jgi:apurinic endonuclease APN1